LAVTAPLAVAFAEVTLTNTPWTSTTPFHLDVKYAGGIFWMLLMTSNKELWIGRSTDATTWTFQATKTFNTDAYRSSFILKQIDVVNYTVEFLIAATAGVNGYKAQYYSKSMSMYYDITIGAGGVPGQNGGSSLIKDAAGTNVITASGGGRGGTHQNAGVNGACGGGAGGNAVNAGGVGSLGYDGGACIGTGDGHWGGSGGGGMSSIGLRAGNAGGNGGAGLTIWGYPVGGGGGGGAYSSYTKGIGTHGGGNGCGNGATNATSGTANTGGGGGGITVGKTAGSGGSGLVIVRYRENPTPPDAPVALDGQFIDSVSFMAEWNDNADYYLIDCSEHSDFSDFVSEEGGDTYHNLVETGHQKIIGSTSGLTPNTTYYYRVRAVNEFGDISDYSNTIAVTTLAE